MHSVAFTLPDADDADAVTDLPSGETICPSFADSEFGEAAVARAVSWRSMATSCASPAVCHLRTAAFDDDASPEVCRWRAATSDDDASPMVCHLRTAAFDDDAPATCQMRAVSFGAQPHGPHLGLLWVPAGAAPMAMPSPFAAAPMPLVSPAGAPGVQSDVAAPAAAAALPSPAASAAAMPAAKGSVLGGRVWQLATDAQGCRQVQQAFDAATSDGERWELAAELQGHVCEAAVCPHANFVLQKAVAALKPEDLQFIVDELRPEAVRAARNKFGCRVVQRLLEQCTAWQVQGIVDAILEDFASVAQSAYGNYVIQHLTEYGSQEQRVRVMRRISSDVRALAADAFGIAVLGGALSRGPAAEQEALAQALLREPGLLVFLSCARHGASSVLRALQVLRGDEREAARQSLISELKCLQASRFGQKVAQAL